MIRFLTLAAAVVLAAHVAPAHAASVEVKVHDLDLSAPEGRAQLDRRIAAAARQVCPVDNIRDLSMIIAAKACYRTALASAQPQLAALVARKTRAA